MEEGKVKEDSMKIFEHIYTNVYDAFEINGKTLSEWSTHFEIKVDEGTSFDRNDVLALRKDLAIAINMLTEINSMYNNASFAFDYLDTEEELKLGLAFDASYTTTGANRGSIEASKRTSKSETRALTASKKTAKLVLSAISNWKNQLNKQAEYLRVLIFSASSGMKNLSGAPY